MRASKTLAAVWSQASYSLKTPPLAKQITCLTHPKAVIGSHRGPLRPSVLTQRFTSSSQRSDTSETHPAFPPEYSRPQNSKGKKPWYKSPITLVLGFIPIFTFGLGYWQIERLKWKVSLIEELEDKLKKETLRLPKNINLEVLPEFEFRLVALKGSFDHSRAMFVGPRVKDGAVGYHVVVPFRRAEGGGMVLVNRGFVSDKCFIGTGANRRLKEGAMPSGEVEFVALLPRIFPPNAFTPSNDPENNLWFHVSPQQMADWASKTAGVSALPLSPSSSLDAANATSSDDAWTPSSGVTDSVKSLLAGSRDEKRVLPIFLEEIFDGNGGEASARIGNGIPVGREATIELRNQHTVYAATWFSLSACTAVMFGLLVKRGRG